MKHVAIVGGGIAGMAAAFALQQKALSSSQPVQVTLLESNQRLGGKIVTYQQDGFVLEGGPDSFITQKPWGLTLCREIGIEDELIPCNEAEQAVYLVKGSQLERMPTGFRLVAPTRWGPFLSSRLLSIGGKLRVAADLFLPARREQSDESIASFLRRRFGAEAMEALGGPMMAGIYVADPEKLSLRATFPMFAELEKKHRSVIRGLVRARKAAEGRPKGPPMFMSFRDGMQTLVDRLESRLDCEIRRGVAVRALHRAAQGWSLDLEPGEPLTVDGVILALPPGGAAELLAPHDAELAAGLRAIRCVSSAVLSLGFRAEDVPASRPLDGFGFVAPKRAGRTMLACTWSSTKFPGRAPEGFVLLRAFVGGATNEAVAELPEDEIEKLVREEIAALMGIRAEPVVRQFTRWPRGNPQYDVGHLDRVADLEAQVADLPGIALAGGAYRGIGIPDCIHGARQAAESI